MSSEQIIPHGHVLRYNLRERLTHWIAAVAYLYLLGTGLAFWSPWLYWLAVALGAPDARVVLGPAGLSRHHLRRVAASPVISLYHIG